MSLLDVTDHPMPIGTAYEVGWTRRGLAADGPQSWRTRRPSLRLGGTVYSRGPPAAGRQSVRPGWSRCKRRCGPEPSPSPGIRSNDPGCPSHTQ